MNRGRQKVEGAEEETTGERGDGDRDARCRGVAWEGRPELSREQ
jgi:hypothetical protein